jgi:hypothetical protein
VVIFVYFSRFGILCQDKSGNSAQLTHDSIFIPAWLDVRMTGRVC